MNENDNENYVRISVEEYFKLRQQAESNAWLMSELERVRSQIRDTEMRVSNFYNELLSLKKEVKSR